jgi:hypothetical protein
MKNHHHLNTWLSVPSLKKEPSFKKILQNDLATLEFLEASGALSGRKM